MNEAWNHNCSVDHLYRGGDLEGFHERALKNGAIGGKVLGGLHGSFMIFFAAPSRHEDIITALSDLVHIPFKFEARGSHILEFK